MSASSSSANEVTESAVTIGLTPPSSAVVTMERQGHQGEGRQSQS